MMRTTRAILVATLVSTAGLAGCIADTGDDVDPANATGARSDTASNASIPTFPDGTPAPTSFQQADCEETIAAFPVRSEAVQPALPEGFEPTFGAGSFLPGSPDAGTTFLILAAFDCAIDGDERVTQHEIGLLVEPPERYRVEWADGYYAQLARVVDDTSLTATFHAWGFSEVHGGEIALDITSTPAGEAGRLTATNETSGFQVEYETAVPGEPSQADGEAVRDLFLGIEDAKVTGTAEVRLGGGGTVSEIGTAVLTTAQTPFDFLQPGMEGLAIHTYSGDEPTTYTYLDDPVGTDGGGSR